MRRILLIVILGSLVLGCGPAETEVDKCIRLKGDGGWRGSSGVPLKTYCEVYDKLKSRDQMCKSSPEKC